MPEEVGHLFSISVYTPQQSWWGELYNKQRQLKQDERVRRIHISRPNPRSIRLNHQRCKEKVTIVVRRCEGRANHPTCIPEALWAIPLGPRDEASASARHVARLGVPRPQNCLVRVDQGDLTTSIPPPRSFGAMRASAETRVDPLCKGGKRAAKRPKG